MKANTPRLKSSVSCTVSVPNSVQKTEGVEMPGGKPPTAKTAMQSPADSGAKLRPAEPAFAAVD